MTHENMTLAKPLDTAPKDHTMIWLLVDYSDEGRNPLEDEILGWTIGFNGEEHTGISQWQFTGWNWQQDCFTEGFGKVVGWYPLTRPNTLPLPTDHDLLAEAMKLPEVAALVDAASCVDHDNTHGNGLEGFRYNREKLHRTLAAIKEQMT